MVYPGRNLKIGRPVLWAFLILCPSYTAFAQPSAPASAGQLFDVQMYSLTQGIQSAAEAASGSVSQLDLKAPGKARREYDKGYELLRRKIFKGLRST